MKYLALIAALSAVAFPAVAQQGTITPYGAYGGPPSGYSFQYQNNSGEISDIGRRYLQQQQQFRPQSTTCTTYGNQTTCTSN